MQIFVNPNMKRWRPVLLYALLITFLSSIPGKNVPAPRLPYADKAAHLVLYSGAGFVTHQAARSVPAAWALAAAYGAFDETYQKLIPRRTSSVQDWCADAAGALIGALLSLGYEKIRSRRASS
jgi:VanZ family protein